MNIYFNWLGNWIELDDDNDCISDMRPSDFIKGLYNIVDIDTAEPYIAPVRIKKDNNEYYVPTNLIVWKQQLKNIPTEERW